MDIEWISDFIELAATKNFTIAAKNRNRSQPAFSRRISGLEQWVGAPLIDRSVHPFSLTKEGEYFRESAQEIIASLYRTRDECRQYQSNKQNFIKFTALHTLAINYFAQWMGDIHQKFSPVRSTMDANNIHDCVEALKSGQAEFMLSYSCRVLPSLLNPAGFLSQCLTTDELILVSAANAKGEPLFVLKQESSTPYLAYPSNCLMGKMSNKIINDTATEAQLNCIYENTVTESIKAMTLQGMGISWLPRICIKPELENGSLVDIGGEPLSMMLDIMLYRPTKRLSNEGESLWAYLQR